MRTFIGAMLGLLVFVPHFAGASDKAEHMQIASDVCTRVLKTHNYAPLSEDEARQKCEAFILSDTRLMPFYKYDLCRSEQAALGRSTKDIANFCGRYAGGGLAIKIASARVKEAMPNRPWKDWPLRGQ